MRILAVDDDPIALHCVRQALHGEHQVTALCCGAEAIERMRAEAFDVVVTDLRMPASDGFAVLAAARAVDPPPPVVVVSGMDTARAAVEALRLGACDFLVKPAGAEEIRRTVAAAVGGPCGSDRSASRGAEPDFGLVGDSPPIRLVRRWIPALAKSREAVLLLGETGTGKELVAHALHAAGPRAAGPFVVHNMAATPAELVESLFFGHVRGAFSGAARDHAGLFECAQGGTLFLDEMDSFPFCLQAKLLRVLESGQIQRVGSSAICPVDVRVIASSAVDPAMLVSQGVFRADLYYRLRQLELMLPPLRERAADIPALVQQFSSEIVEQGGTRPRVSPAALARLTAYRWPGNVRELRNAVRAAALLAIDGTILPEHLPRAIEPDQGGTKGGSLHAVESEHILKTLRISGGNHSRAARILGIDRGTLARKLAALRERGST